MQKLLLSAFFLAVLMFNNASARDYIYQDNSYNNQPRYHRLTNEEVRKYKEKKVYTEETNINKIRPYIGIDLAVSEMNLKNRKFLQGINGYKKEDNYYVTQEKYKKSINSKALSGYIGAKFNNYIGAELFYQKSDKTKTQHSNMGMNTGVASHTFSSLDYEAYGADIIGYIPINQSIEILAALGLGQYEFDYKTNGITAFEGREYTNTIHRLNKEFDSLGMRFGLGAQYNITDHIALRSIFRYIKMTDDDFVKDMMEVSLGMQYIF